MDVKPITMTTAQASAAYGVKVKKLRQLILDGRLPAKKVDSAKYIPVSALDRMFCP